MQCQRGFAMIAGSALSVLGVHATSLATTLDADDRALMPAVFFSVPAGFEHQFRTDINRGGAFDVSRGTVGLGARMSLPHDMDLTLRFNYSLDAYNFRGNGSFGDGWDDIHTINFGAIFSAQLSTDWRVFGGPAFQFARESGADWGDSFAGGGFAGATYQYSEDLTIGGGFGVVSQIEDSARFFPIVVLNWRIMDGLMLTSTTAASAAGDTGLELVYQVGGGWEAALGGAYRFRRFRLDENGPVPDGVGQDTNLPLWARVSYAFTEQFRVNAYVGITAGGNLRLEDSRGNRIARQNYDAAPFIGISGMLRF